MPNLTFAVGRKIVTLYPSISGGFNYSLYLTKTGRAWAWGINSQGQLGDNNINQRISPVSVLGAVKTFCQISAGSGLTSANSHSLAIDKNGRAWAWGSNTSGQLGDNTIVSKRTPVSVLGTVKTFCQISAGNTFSLAIDKNGRAWGWGINGSGQLGDNTIVSKRTPVSVLGAVKTFCQITTATGTFSLAIDKNGRAWGWGNNGSGQLGDNTTVSKLTPVSVLGAVKTFCQISAGNSFSLVIDKNGRAWAWGDNTSGQLGDNTTVSKLTPVSVVGTVKTFCRIAVGGSSSVAIDKDGRAWAWGDNTSGQLGDNTTVSKLTPVSVVGTVKTFCRISAGRETHTLAIDKDGNIWGWGNNINGQLDNFAAVCSPRSVLGAVKTFCSISTKGNIQGIFSTAIDKNGRAWTWGSNTNGQLGDNSIAPKTSPVSVLGAVKTFCQISAGGNFSVAIDKNGRAWAWGDNTSGQLGDNTIVSKRTPVSVLGAVKTFCQISGGLTYSISIDKNGRAWGWGINGSGQLGDNTTVSKLTPVSVLGAVKTFCRISANDNHTLAIDKDGKSWGWGFNNAGQLGDNTITQRLTPVSVAGAVKTFCRISAGNSNSGGFSLAIDKNGRAWAWGANGTGQLGDNTIVSKRTPVSVLGAVKTFCQISTGGSGFNSGFSVAIDKNGRAWAWGSNFAGQLGDGTTTSKLTPVSVAGAVKTFCQITAGFSQTIAIDKNGRAWGWGGNSLGYLGVSPYILTPTKISYL